MAPAPAKPSKAPEFVYTKTGKAFRALGNIAAIQTNERGWLVTPEEEKDLGEAVGDILLELGLNDTMAAKVVFAVGTVSAVFGSKAIAIAQHRAAHGSPQMRPAPVAAPAAQPPAGSPPPPAPITPAQSDVRVTEAAAPVPVVSDDKVPTNTPGIPEAKPGNL